MKKTERRAGCKREGRSRSWRSTSGSHRGAASDRWTQKIVTTAMDSWDAGGTCYHCSNVPLFHCTTVPLAPVTTPHLPSSVCLYFLRHLPLKLRITWAGHLRQRSWVSVRFLFPLWSSLLFAGLFGIHCQCNAVRGKATDATLVSLAGALLLLKKQRVGGGEEGYGGTTPKFLIYIPLCPSLLPPPSRHVLTHPKPFWPLTIYLETQVNPQTTKYEGLALSIYHP